MNVIMHVNMDRNLLGSQVFALRTERGLTLRAAAEKCGVSHAYIQAIEKCRPNANITLDILEKLSAGLGGRLGVTLQDERDDLDAAASALGPHEREKLATVVRALLVAREDRLVAAVVDAALGMVASRVPSEERASG